MSWFVVLLRLVLGVALLVAGVLKAGHVPEFAAQIAGFRLLPAALVAPLALALPYVEMLLGLYLVIGLFTRIVAVIVSIEFVIYAAAIASAVLRHIAANCGCFGPNDHAVADWPHVALDLVLAALAAIVARGAPGALALDWRLNRR